MAPPPALAPALALVRGVGPWKEDDGLLGGRIVRIALARERVPEEGQGPVVGQDYGGVEGGPPRPAPGAEHGEPAVVPEVPVVPGDEAAVGLHLRGEGPGRRRPGGNRRGGGGAIAAIAIAAFVAIFAAFAILPVRIPPGPQQRGEERPGLVRTQPAEPGQVPAQDWSGGPMILPSPSRSRSRSRSLIAVPFAVPFAVPVESPPPLQERERGGGGGRASSATSAAGAGGRKEGRRPREQEEQEEGAASGGRGEGGRGGEGGGRARARARGGSRPAPDPSLPRRSGRHWGAAFFLLLFFPSSLSQRLCVHGDMYGMLHSVFITRVHQVLP